MKKPLLFGGLIALGLILLQTLAWAEAQDQIYAEVYGELGGFPVVRLKFSPAKTYGENSSGPQYYLLRASPDAGEGVKSVLSSLVRGTDYIITGHVFAQGTASYFSSQLQAQVNPMEVVSVALAEPKKMASLPGPKPVLSLPRSSLTVAQRESAKAKQIKDLRLLLKNPRYTSNEDPQRLKALRGRVLTAMLMAEYPKLAQMAGQPERLLGFSEVIDSALWIWSQPGPDRLTDLLRFIADQVEPRYNEGRVNPRFCQLELQKGVQFGDSAEQIAREQQSRQRLTDALAQWRGSLVKIE